ncbi:flagellar motor protein [Pseudomonadota bacterium]|nr:flagellar motor protein [Pseudomonadota bacterium]
MDILSLLGIILGFGAIIGGQYLDGGHIDSILNGIALLIVLGGTLGAVMLQTPLSTFIRALKMLSWVFFPPQYKPQELLENLLEWNQVARREGLFKLESVADLEEDPFIQKSLQLISDGGTPEMIREILENDLYIDESRDIQSAKVYEAMGGYCPTIGIIGAVLGLIHVMRNLADPSTLGSGIAVAFIATIYGVGLANLLFLPIASKLRSTIERRSSYYVMLIEGIIKVADGENPHIIESHLQVYLD